MKRAAIIHYFVIAPLLWLSLAASAEPAPPVIAARVLYPADYRLPAGERVRVATDLLQLDLGHGRVLSAQRGAEFEIALTGDLIVARGPVQLADLTLDSFRPLPLGSHAVAASTASLVDSAEPATQDTRYQLSNAVMVRQQQYLDSLKIDVRDINQLLANVIRALAPKSK